jgi:superfamily I DNA/RNA helicase
MLKALARVPERFDALLVDEGQDFTAGYWRCLQRLLADPAAARVYVFRDEAQDVFGGGGGGGGADGGGEAAGGEAGLLEGVPEYRLFDNCRNTRSIHAVSRALADDETEARTPIPPPLHMRREALGGVHAGAEEFA